VLNVQLSLACWPGLPWRAAVDRLLAPLPEEPCFGQLRRDHVQLVPQLHGILTEALADDLRRGFPDTRFRLHANVRVLPEQRFYDLSSLPEHLAWFRQAGRVSQRLDAPAYSAHAGRRDLCRFDELLDHAARCADLFGCPVAIEGHYPTRDNRWHLSSWAEYRALFESGVPYALDLSHLNIVAAHERRQELELVSEMLACERCLEIHVSDNDGTSDQHDVCADSPWWLHLLEHAHPGAVVFSEGNHRRQEIRQERCHA
jgi:hypothetical protein